MSCAGLWLDFLGWSVWLEAHARCHSDEPGGTNSDGKDHRQRACLCAVVFPPSSKGHEKNSPRFAEKTCDWTGDVRTERRKKWLLKMWCMRTSRSQAQFRKNQFCNFFSQDNMENQWKTMENHGKPMIGSDFWILRNISVWSLEGWFRINLLHWKKVPSQASVDFLEKWPCGLSVQEFSLNDFKCKIWGKIYIFQNIIWYNVSYKYCKQFVLYLHQTYQNCS